MVAEPTAGLDPDQPPDALHFAAFDDQLSVATPPLVMLCGCAEMLMVTGAAIALAAKRLPTAISASSQPIEFNLLAIAVFLLFARAPTSKAYINQHIMRPFN